MRKHYGKEKILTAEQYASFIDPTPRPWIDPVTGKAVIDPLTGKPQLFSPANCAEWVRAYEAGEIIIVSAKSEKKDEGSKESQSSAASDQSDLGEVELGGDDAPESI